MYELESTKASGAGISGTSLIIPKFYISSIIKCPSYISLQLKDTFHLGPNEVFRRSHISSKLGSLRAFETCEQLLENSWLPETVGAMF